VGRKNSSANHVSFTDKTGTTAGYLDLHFEAFRPAYEAMLRSVGLQPGWRVVDAGCGGGSYLPLLAELVGPTGSISAFDLAPENVTRVRELVAGWRQRCSVRTEVASLTALPYADAEFDALWSANAVEYLSSEEVSTALSEFRRVVRPGGLVGIKDTEPGLWCISPADPTLLWRMWEAVSHISAPFRGSLHHTRTMRRRLERVGFVDVWQRASVTEFWAPLSPVQREWVAELLMQMGALAERAGVPEADLDFWRRQRDPQSPDNLSHDPDLFWCEGYFVTVGRVPEG
jgi:arsenite methyltransferase